LRSKSSIAIEINASTAKAYVHAYLFPWYSKRSVASNSDGIAHNTNQIKTFPARRDRDNDGDGDGDGDSNGDRATTTSFVYSREGVFIKGLQLWPIVGVYIHIYTRMLT
jgi:hypothetical protein